jgi:hypothetical protein
MFSVWLYLKKPSKYTTAISSSVVIKALCYKLEDGGFKTRCGEVLLICLIFPATSGFGFHSASNINEYQKHKNNASGEKSAAGA